MFNDVVVVARLVVGCPHITYTYLSMEPQCVEKPIVFVVTVNTTDCITNITKSDTTCSH